VFTALLSDPLLWLWLVLPNIDPLTRARIVDHGASNRSSWSIPIMLAPLLLSTPTTRNVTFLTRISLPKGDCPANNSRTSVWPSTHTRLPLRMSRSLNISPAVMRPYCRTSRNAAVVP